MLDNNNSNNNFSGKFQVNIWLLPSVHTLLISDNNITSTMPIEISSNISQIEMQNNHFSDSTLTFETGLLVLMV
uniref:Uncharacterized protein n=1 Tax=Aegilops tauschii subsp. strangulata TaxID=200361 RepID=A0A453LNT5_AEGTS